MPRKIVFLVVCSIALMSILTACDGQFQDNPLGYSFVGSTLTGNQNRKIELPSSTSKPIPGLRSYGMGVTPNAFGIQYGQALAPSQPPTQFWFKASLDDFPNGSVLIVGFDRSSKDGDTRANEISYVAGDKHPVTDTQAETIAESFLPSDAQGPTLLNKYNEHANTCQSETYTSPTLASLFPAQDFLDASGNIAKPGTVTLSLFPHYERSTDTPPSSGAPKDEMTGNTPNIPNDISSFLLTLGTKPYC